MNRGSYFAESDPLGDFIASMRPRFMNRGSYAADRPRVDQTRGFNEAPIHESGK